MKQIHPTPTPIPSGTLASFLFQQLGSPVQLAFTAEQSGKRSSYGNYVDHEPETSGESAIRAARRGSMATDLYTTLLLLITCLIRFTYDRFAGQFKSYFCHDKLHLEGTCNGYTIHFDLK